MNDNYLILIILIFTAGLVIFLLFMNNKYWGPKTRRKILKSKAFNKFKELGFTENRENILGSYSGFMTLIGYHWTGSAGKPVIYIQIDFDSDNLSEKHLTELQEKYGNKFFSFKWKQDNYVWNKNALLSEMEYNIFPPKFNAILKQIDKMIKILHTEKLESKICKT